MKLKIKKVATFHRVIIDGSSVKFGWYESGKAFIAKDNELLTYDEAYKIFFQGNGCKLRHYFYISNKCYEFSLDGIVHYLIDKYYRK